MSEESPNIPKVPTLEYDPEYWTDIVFQWADSKFLIKDSSGNEVEAGTILRIRNKIEFLHHLTDSQLRQLKEAVSQAVEYELSKRKSTI